MFNRFFLVPAALSCAVLFTAAGSAFAQHAHGSSGHGSAHMSGHSGGHVGGGHVGGGVYNHSYNSHGYNHGYNNHGYHHGGFGYYPGNLGGSYFPWYDTTPLYDAYPSYSYDNGSAVRYSDSSAQVYAASPMVSVNDYANIRVLVGNPQARVWFDGHPTEQTGMDRLFSSPLLNTSSNYSYQIRATWIQDGREIIRDRTVSVTPGQVALVDLTR